MELLLIVGIILLLSGIVLIDRITGWLGAGDDVFELVKQYSRIILVGAPLFMINVGLAFFVRNDGRPNLTMIGTFVSIAAYSTVAGQMVSVLILLTHFLSSKNTLKFHLNFNQKAIRIIRNGGSTPLPPNTAHCAEKK